MGGKVRMDIEDVFVSHFAIGKKPDIFELIGAAVQVGAWKHPVEFKKRKEGILKLLMNPGKRPGDIEGDEAIDSSDDESELEYEVMDTEFEKDELTGAEIEDDEVINNAGTEIGYDVEELAAEIEELVQEKSCRFGDDQETCHQEKENISNIKSTVVEQSSKHLVSNRENKTQGGNCRIITSAMVSSNVKQLHKQSKKGQRQTTKDRLRKKLGFKKMKADIVRHKRIEGTQQTPTKSNNKNNNVGSATKQCSTRMTKLNVAIKRIEVAPPHGKQLLSDCSQQKKLEEGDQQLLKQNNYTNRDLKERWAAKFESSKRKFGERIEEISKAKRRTIMVDFDDMQKPPKDPSAPKRCWDRRRF